MRKYQQLVLLVVSCISLIVLFMYKNENNRLKYVLEVVNFFGRKDAAIFAQFENATGENVDFAHPLPVWQALDDSFHAYAAYWSAVPVGGRALAEVVGKRDANVQFRCYVQFEDNTIIEGRFQFQLWHQELDASRNYIYYSFFCQLSQTKRSQPENVYFTPSRQQSSDQLGVPLHLRSLEAVAAATTPTQPLTVCLDLASTAASTRQFTKHKKYMLQFFLHHKVLGVEHFIVYNGDALPSGIVRLLRQALVQLHLLPFNFPFAASNATTASLRKFIQVDCLRRNTLAAQHVMVLAPNEFFYAKNKLSATNTLLQTMDKYEAPVTHFRVTKLNICLNAQKPLLIDNTAYAASQPTSVTYIYRLKHMNLLGPTALLVDSVQSPALPVSLAYVHTYGECAHIGADGLNDWRSTQREDFIHFLQAERNDLSIIIK